jgi:hypothetical protein
MYPASASTSASTSGRSASAASACFSRDLTRLCSSGSAAAGSAWGAEATGRSSVPQAAAASRRESSARGRLPAPRVTSPPALTFGLGRTLKEVEDVPGEKLEYRCSMRAGSWEEWRSSLSSTHPQLPGENRSGLRRMRFVGTRRPVRRCARESQPTPRSDMSLGEAGWRPIPHLREPRDRPRPRGPDSRTHPQSEPRESCARHSTGAPLLRRRPCRGDRPEAQYPVTGSHFFAAVSDTVISSPSTPSSRRRRGRWCRSQSYIRLRPSTRQPSRRPQDLRAAETASVSVSIQGSPRCRARRAAR